jgi:hypothetical protein
MKPIWSNPEPEPTPEQLAAWADGELGPEEARRVGAWLAGHPDDAARVEMDHQVVHLYRDNPPPDPTPSCWQLALDRIESSLAAPPRAEVASPRRYLALGFGLVAAAAAVLGGVVLARALWPVPPVQPELATPLVKFDPADDNDQPFEVVSASEVDILQMDARDADRVVIGRPLLGTFELVSADEIEVVQVEADPDDGWMPRLQGGPEVPMIVVARIDKQ